MFPELQMFPTLIDLLTITDDQDQLLLRVLMQRLGSDTLDLLQEDDGSCTRVWHLLSTRRGQYDDAAELVEAIKIRYGIDIVQTWIGSEVKPILEQMAELEKDPDNHELRLQVLFKAMDQLFLEMARRTSNFAGHAQKRGVDSDTFSWAHNYALTLIDVPKTLRRELGLE